MSEQTTIGDLQLRRWLADDELDRLVALSHEDCMIAALLGGLRDCHTGESVIRLLAQMIVDQSRQGLAWRKMATDAIALHPKPPMIFVQE